MTEPSSEKMKASGVWPNTEGTPLAISVNLWPTGASASYSNSLLAFCSSVVSPGVNTVAVLKNTLDPLGVA